jgi:hypothetical protein
MGNVILTEKQLEKLINKMKTINENHSEGSYMSRQQLFTIATLAHAMWEKMEDGEQLEDWMESKIAQAEQSIVGVVKTFMYDEFKNDSQTSDGMGKLDYDEIIIGK